MMFFLPLAASGVHIMFAFPMIARLLALMNMTNVKLFAWCTAGTFGVFAATYCAVYMMTSRVLYEDCKLERKLTGGSPVRCHGGGL